MASFDHLFPQLLDARQGAFALCDPDPRSGLRRLIRGQARRERRVMVRLAHLGRAFLFGVPVRSIGSICVFIIRLQVAAAIPLRPLGRRRKEGVESLRLGIGADELVRGDLRHLRRSGPLPYRSRIWNTRGAGSAHRLCSLRRTCRRQQGLSDRSKKVNPSLLGSKRPGGPYLNFITPTLSLLLEDLGEFFADELDHLVFVFKADLLLGWVDVDVDLGRVDLEGQVDERTSAFRKEGPVESLKRALQRRAVNVAVCGVGRELMMRVAERQPRGVRLMKKRKVLFLAWKLAPLHQAETLTLSSSLDAFTSTSSRLTASP